MNLKFISPIFPIFQFLSIALCVVVFSLESYKYPGFFTTNIKIPFIVIALTCLFSSLFFAIFSHNKIYKTIFTLFYGSFALILSILLQLNSRLVQLSQQNEIFYLFYHLDPHPAQSIIKWLWGIFIVSLIMFFLTDTIKIFHLFGIILYHLFNFLSLNLNFIFKFIITKSNIIALINSWSFFLYLTSLLIFLKYQLIFSIPFNLNYAIYICLGVVTTAAILNRPRNKFIEYCALLIFTFSALVHLSISYSFFESMAITFVIIFSITLISLSENFYLTKL